MTLSRGSVRPRVVVVGGSIAGLLCALLLRRAGCEVDVFERSTGTLESRGAGIVTHPELFAVLARAGLDDEPASLGVRVPGRRLLGPDGAILAEPDLDQIVTSWGRLYRLLRTAFPTDRYHLGAELGNVEEGDKVIWARFTNGESLEADCVIGADGLFSTVRRQMLPKAAPLYAGYVAWRGLVRESELSPAARAALCDRFTFCLPPGEQMLGYPVAGANEKTVIGQRRFNFVWYRPADAAEKLPWLLTDIDGAVHELSIPPNRIRPEVTAEMRAEAARLLAPAFAEAVARTAQPFLQAILDFETPSMALGRARRVAVVGDAAFVARPHVGMGVTKAAGDAAALLDAFVESGWDVPAALARFDRARHPCGAAIVDRARALGAYMQAQRRTNSGTQYGRTSSRSGRGSGRDGRCARPLRRRCKGVIAASRGRS